tara:strand:+ start:342 stop:569 length:228 start_codon:yes stop_codon:yes gene_type:complete
MTKANQLHDVLPNSILEHYADQQRLTTIGTCAVFLLDNKEWGDRLFNDNTLFSQEDIIHDFVGLMVEDEFFLPRL